MYPSATVILLKEVAGGFEVLLVKRNPALKFLGGKWVFPGGKVDSVDHGRDLDCRMRAAAVRELAEETGLSIESDQLIDFAHWVTPQSSPLRFSTGFYVSILTSKQTISIDHSEIIDYCWIKPQQAIVKNTHGQVRLSVPTFVSLMHLKELAFCHGEIDLSTLPEPFHYLPVIVKTEAGVCAIFAEDSAYRSGDIDFRAEQLHRVLMEGDGWRYQFSQ